MIVSPARGFVFVHAPKTGGTSMALALEAHAPDDDILIGDTPEAKRRKRRLNGVKTAGRLWKHSTLRDIRGLLPDAVLDGLRPVMMVRNPWDRLVSYYHWLRAQDFDSPAVARAKALTFRDFILDPHTGAAFRANPYARYVAGGRDPIFIRLEHFGEDFQTLVPILGYVPDLPMSNRSDRARDYRGYYDDATRDRVAAFCAEDIAAFSYLFEPPDPA